MDEFKELEKLNDLMDVFCAYLKYINGFHHLIGGYANGHERRRDDENVYLTFNYGIHDDDEKKYIYECRIAIEDLKRDISAEEMMRYITDGGYDEES